MAQDIVIIDYKAGNIRSVLFALERLGVHATLSDDPSIVSKADKVIFPGVGEAGTAMSNLQRKGMDQCIASLEQPVLAICIGQQLICGHSEESDTRCIGVFPFEVCRFRSKDLKVPHMGWNKIYNLKGPLFKNVPEEAYVYFVHSYFVDDNEYSAALCDYGAPFAAAMMHDNFMTTQFHPEKSGTVGEIILKNFVEL